MTINSKPAFLKSFFAKGHERTVRAKKNIIVSFITKALSIGISFLIVPLTLSYVGKEEYGIWMTISAIINWFAFFDVGLGNGLRNKLSEALALNEKETAKVYISSVYSIIFGIAITLFLVFLAVAKLISWNSVLNTEILPNDELFLIVTMVFFFFCIGFVFKLLSSILAALQRYALNDVIGLIAQVSGLLAIYILVNTTDGSLLYLCLVYGSKTAIILIFASIILFTGSLKELRPSLSFVQINRAKPLLKLGLRFFINQILYLIVTQSSVILVVQFFGPEDVTVFNLAVRFVTITSIAYIMILKPFLTAFTEAYTKNEFDWIRITIKRINLIWLIVSIFTGSMIFLYEWFFHIWVGDAISVPLSLIIALVVSTIINMWSSTYTLFLNGIGKIKMQLYILASQAILFIPFSYFFYKLEFGLSSIVMAQILFYVAGAFVFTIQYKRIINNRATGLWNK